MRKIEPRTGAVLDARHDQTLIGVVLRQDGEEVVRYFAGDTGTAAAVPQDAVERALAAIGSWADLDFDETLDALDRNRHQSTPTPPIEFDV
jgi:hypothetical protein